MVRKKIRQLNQKVRDYFIEILSIKTSPHSIAMGFALGTLIEILPTFGLVLILTFLIFLLFPRISKISFFAALLFWNPLFTIPLYGLSYEIGDMIFGNVHIVKYDVVILNNIYNFSRRFLVGNLIIVVLMSVASYVIVRVFAEIYQRNRQKDSQ